MEQEIEGDEGRNNLNIGSAFCRSRALIASPQRARKPVRLKETVQEEVRLRGDFKEKEIKTFFGVER